MASTNKTTNYQLSQFSPTDKPAWLGDYNQDMSKIDAGMKANASDIDTVENTVSTLQTAVSGNTSSIEALQTSVGTNTSDIADLKTADTTLDGKILTAQNTADRADGKADTNASNIASQGLDITSLQADNTTNIANIAQNASDINTVKTNLENFESNFNLTNISSVDTWSFGKLIGAGKLTLAQSASSAIYKLYGRLEIANNSGSSTTVAKSAITGLSGYYGFKTTLKLTTPPAESYIVEGILNIYEYQSTHDIDAYSGGFAVDTDGYIWVCANTQNNISLGGYYHTHFSFAPCIYFNQSFGDKPEEPEN